MTRLRELVAIAAMVVLTVVLSACGGLPTSGPVNAGQPITDDDADSVPVPIPDGPVKDATPQQIVEGFIAAGSGPRDNWATAQLFLAPDFRTEWDPSAGVIVYSAGERDLQEVAENEFTLSVAPVATVDDAGALSTPDDAGQIPLQYNLAQQPDGQWRITQAPQGIVLDRNRFITVFGHYALQFFDPQWTYLVPDTRWFPRLYASTSIAEALIDGGPSPWLADSVATAFADGARLATLSVPVRSGNIAAVSLQEGARSLDPVVLDRMQTQLETSLADAGIAEVDMLVDEQPLVADPVSVRRTTVDSRPLVRTADGFGFLSGNSLEAIPGLSEALLKISTADIEVNADRTSAAVRTAGGAVVRIDDEGTTTTLDPRAGLVAPTIDPLGYVWTVPQSEPMSVAAFASDGSDIAIAAAWPGAAQVLVQRVSRDGTRIAAVVRDGQTYALWIAGVIRDRNGAPTGLGQPKPLAALPAPASGLTWLDSSTLAVLTSSDGDPHLYTQGIGSFGTLDRIPDNMVGAAGGSQSGGLRLLDASGELYTQRGANWQQLASGVSVLAIQQGSPG